MKLNTFYKQGAALALCLTLSFPVFAEKDLVQYVNTLQGTNSTYELSWGNTYPTTAVPYPMNSWSPQTGKNGDGWKYQYSATTIRGFQPTHQCSPWVGDYGVFSLMPVPELVVDESKRATPFSHDKEIAKPHYYKVTLENGITTEFSPTTRSAHFRFSFPAKGDAFLVLDGYTKTSQVQIDVANHRITGYVHNGAFSPKTHKNYFIIQFDKPFVSYGTWENRKNTIQKNNLSREGEGIGAYVQFAKGSKVQAKVSTSYISPEQAEVTMTRELGKHSSVEVTKQAAADVWNQLLNRVLVEGGTEEDMKTFYSCMFRANLFSHKFYEEKEDGSPYYYSPYDEKIHDGYMFTDNGFWDTFRCLFPFLNLMYPSMNQKMQEGLVNAYKESGFLPEWASPGHRDCMVGNNSASVVADAYIKGLRGYDIETLWEALKHGANAHLRGTASGRLGYESYNQLGYVANNIGIGQNVARTLEYAYNDWAIYTLGKKLGKPESEIDIYKKHALNYKNVYHPERKLMVGKDNKGVFNPNFDAVDWSGEFCEGNSWHWSFCVFHDPQGLINLMGGKKEFNAMMDSVFVIPGKLGMESRGMIHEMREMQVMNMGQYAHGNQPIQHMVYLYNYSSEPWKAQYWIREIMNKLYTAGPDGYCGDEDNGQTSAWYVFSALGFYPVCPGTDEYIIGTPLFKSAKLHLENGKTITIKADNNQLDNRYIKEMKVNGKSQTRNFLTHDQLIKGANIQFQMSPVPNKQRGTTEKDVPYSLSFE